MAQAGKRGAIPKDLAPLLERLGLKADEFIDALQKLGQSFPRLVGPPKDLAERAQQVGRKWLQGVTAAIKLFHDASTTDRPVSKSGMVPGKVQKARLVLPREMK